MTTVHGTEAALKIQSGQCVPRSRKVIVKPSRMSSPTRVAMAYRTIETSRLTICCSPGCTTKTMNAALIAKIAPGMILNWSSVTTELIVIAARRAKVRSAANALVNSQPRELDFRRT
jgi:hypothetical protein